MSITSFRYFLGLVFLLLSSSIYADNKPLLPSQAFIPTLTITDNQITINVNIEPGYYVYRDKTKLRTNNTDIDLASITLSDGKIKDDPYFGKVSIWENQATVTSTVKNLSNKDVSDVLILTLQGCQDDGICYPPEDYQLPIKVNANTIEQPSSNGSLLSLPTSKTNSSLVSNSDLELGANSSANSLLSIATNPSLLPEDEAFKLSVNRLDRSAVELHWQIAKDYYLYKNKIKVELANNPIVQTIYAPTIIHSDEFYGEQPVYRNKATVRVYFTNPIEINSVLNVEFQGCADVGVCYPIMQQQVQFDDNDANLSEISLATVNTDAANTQSPLDEWVSKLQQNVVLSVSLIFIAGLLLAFTPCVLPMLPILLGIISRQANLNRKKSLVLSFSYVLGMAVMTAGFGLIVSATGINLQIIFQKPFLLILFASVFVVMGLAMLGLFHVALPNSLQAKIYNLQNRLQDSRPHHLFMIGALSVLVVGPCVAPPLIAVLTFISSTNNVVLGTLYLFVLGFGMGFPLIFFAVMAGKIPKSGQFSVVITQVFAILMFGVAIWLINRLLPLSVGMMLWGILALASAYFIAAIRPKSTQLRIIPLAIALLFLALGGSWLAGGIMGNTNPLHPFTKFEKLEFTYIETLNDLNNEIATSKQPIMVDFYADWCVSCLEIELNVFTQADVIEAAKEMRLLKIDLTEMSDDKKAIIEEFELVGPPVFLFFSNGQEIKQHRRVGVVTKEDFITIFDSLSK